MSESPLKLTAPMKRYLTVTNLADWLGVSRDTVYAMEARGELPRRVKIGKRMVWFGPALEDWERRRTGAGASL